MVRGLSVHATAFLLFAALATTSLYGAATLTAAPAQLDNARVGAATNQTITISGGAPSYSISISGVTAGGTGLDGSNVATDPSGTVTISGTPTGPGVFSFKIDATDSNSNTLAQKTYILSVFQITPANPILAGGDSHVALTRTIVFSNGSNSYSTNISALTPTALNLTVTAANGTITLSGTPNLTGTASFTATVTDRVTKTSVTQTFSIVINSAPSFSPTSLTDADIGVPYTNQITVSGGTHAYSTLTVANFTDGGTGLAAPTADTSSGKVTFNSTPNALGTASFDLTLTDSANAMLTQHYSILVSSNMTFDPVGPLLPPTDTGIFFYNQTITVSNGSTPYASLKVLNFDGGGTGMTAPSALASGQFEFLTLASNAGTVSFDVSVVDAAGVSKTQHYTILVNPTPSFNPLPDYENDFAHVNDHYNQTISVTGGTAPFTILTVNGYSDGGTGMAPPTVNINSGTVTFDSAPSAIGTVTFGITVVDSAGGKSTSTYSIEIIPPLSLSPTPLAGAKVGDDSFQRISVTNAYLSSDLIIDPASFDPGTTGLTLNDILATPDIYDYTYGLNLDVFFPPQAGCLQFDVHVTDSLNSALSQRISLSIFKFDPRFAALTVGAAPNDTQTITGGLPPYVITVSGFDDGGTGLNVSNVAIDNTTGTVKINNTAPGAAATATRPGYVEFNLEVIDSTGASYETFNIIPVNPLLSISPQLATPTILDSVVVNGYSVQQLTVSGGTAPYLSTVTNFSDPSMTGMTVEALESVGVFNVFENAVNPGTISFQVNVTDAAGATLSQTYTVTATSALQITPDAAPNIRVGTPYTLNISATGGSPNYTTTISDFSAGTTGFAPPITDPIAGTATLSGTPSAGTVSFTISVTDFTGETANKTYSITAAAAPTISPAMLPDAEVDSRYQQVISLLGGSLPFAIVQVTPGTDATTGLEAPQFDYTAQTLTFNDSPTAAGDAHFHVNVTDALGAVVSANYTIHVHPALTLTPPPNSLHDGESNVIYNQVLTLTGGSPPYTDLSILRFFASSETGLTSAFVTPNVAAGSVAISGTPTGGGFIDFTVSATDSLGVSLSGTYFISIDDALSMVPGTLPSTDIGVAYDQSVDIYSGAQPFAALTVSAFSDGGTGLSSSGITVVQPNHFRVQGTPTGPGTATFTLNVTDAAGATLSKNYSIVVNNSMTLSPPQGPLPPLTADFSYNSVNHKITVSQGMPSYSLTVTAFNGGTTGLTKSFLFVGNGYLAFSGEPKSAGTVSFNLNVTDAAGGKLTNQAYSIVVNPPLVLSPTSLPKTDVGLAFNKVLTVTSASGTPPYAITILSFNGSTSDFTEAGNIAIDDTAGTVTISANPTKAGIVSFVAKVTDAAGATLNTDYFLTINPQLNVAPAAITAVTEGTQSNQTITVSGGTAPYTTLTVSNINSGTTGLTPDAFSLNAATGTVTLDGTFTKGTATFDVIATDFAGESLPGGKQSYTLTVNPPLNITPAVLIGATAGTATHQTISVTDGTLPYTALTIPAFDAGGTGLLISSLSENLAAGTVTLDGTPTRAGTATFTLNVTDKNGAQLSKGYTLTVRPAISITTTSLPEWTINQAGYSQTVSTTGGTGTTTFAITSGAFPTGLNLDTNLGVISGTPTVANTFNFTISATDSVGAVSSKQYALKINSAVAITTLNLADCTAHFGGYSHAIAATGGTGVLTYTTINQNLPAGLTLDIEGNLSGTPAVAGTYTFTVTTTDTTGASASRSFTVVVNAPVTITTASIPNWTVNVAGYNQTIGATGGTGALTFTTDNANLPAGLSLSSSGVISGTPTAARTSTFVVTATDSIGATGTATYNVIIAPTIVMTTGTTLPNGILTVAYSQQLAATGGTGALTFSSGALPPGLTLSTAGVLSGTPTAVALNSTFNVTLTDAVGATGIGVFQINIVGSQPVINSVAVTPASAVVGQDVTVDALGVTSDDGQPAVLTIDFADGSTPVVGSTATHVYMANGVYMIKVTATSAASGLFSTITQPFNIGGAITGNTIVIGKSGQSAKSGFSSRYTINYGTVSKSLASGRIVHLVLPPTLLQNDLTGQTGLLTIGSGPQAVTYPFALTSKASAKTVALTAITIAVKSKTAQFTTKPDARLASYAQSIGVLSTVKAITVQIPITIEIPGKVFIYVEVELLFKCQTGKISTGTLTR